MATVEDLTKLINEKGEEIRALKAGGSVKDALMPHVQQLLDLKEQYELASFYLIHL